MKKRSSILLYFDNYHLISSLPDDQLALLFRALMEFSELEINGGGADLLTFPNRYPKMQDRAIGYFLFMADNVRRDAAAYNEKCANYRAAAQRREEGKAAAREEGAPRRKAAPAQKQLIEDDAWNYVF